MLPSKIFIKPSLTLLVQYLRFCFVGGSGLVVDMAILWFLTSRVHWPVIPSKLVAAEVAVANNFLWNNVWTFQSSSGRFATIATLLRFLRFNVVCASGIMVSVLLILGLNAGLAVPILAANGLAIVLVSVWNFSLTHWWVWRRSGDSGPQSR